MSTRHPNIIQDRTGVWTAAEQAVEDARLRAQQNAAAEAALAIIETRIDAIRADATKTEGEKLRELRRLTASGYSREEFDALRAAQANG